MGLEKNSHFCYSSISVKYAGMAELADALDLGSSVHDVQVQVLLPAVSRQAGGSESFLRDSEGSFSMWLISMLTSAGENKHTFLA